MMEPYRNYHPYVHPTAWVHPTAVLIGEVILHADVSIWPGVILRGDQGSIEIGEGTNLQDGVVAHATGGISNVFIGPKVTVGHRAILHGCTVQSCALIGMGSIILDNAIIEPDCIVGAGTVVPANRRIPQGSLVLGSPGRVVRALTESDRKRIDIGYQTYIQLKYEYSKKNL
jgi:carbonic anhydrase/acetyltransferase-like protein (isoleucine patch superfamily)